MGNYAPNPNTQDIYNQLATISLNDVTAEQIQKLTNPVTISSDNQDSLLTMNTVNRAAMRDGMPMPDTGAIQIKTISDNTTQEIFRPQVGEVWQLMGVSFQRTAGDGSSVYTMYICDDDGNEVYWFYASSSDTVVSFSADSNFPDFPMYYDNKMFLKGAASNGAGGGGIGGSWKIAVIRIR